MTNRPDRLPLTLLEQRGIEASFIKPFLAAWEAEVGRERAAERLRTVIEGLAREAGARLKPSLPAGMEGLAAAWTGFAAGGALEVERLEQSERRLRLRVRRCAYVDLYRELGLSSWGPLLSCGRDAPFAEGLCPGVRLERSQTLMEGGSSCELLYTKEEP